MLSDEIRNVIAVIRRVIAKTVINKTVELGQQNLHTRFYFQIKNVLQLNQHEVSAVGLKMRCGKEEIFSWTKKAKRSIMCSGQQ